MTRLDHHSRLENESRAQFQQTLKLSEEVKSELTRTGLESIQSEGSTLIRYRPGAVTILSGGKEVTLPFSADALAVLLDDVARAAAGR